MLQNDDNSATIDGDGRLAGLPANSIPLAGCRRLSDVSGLREEESEDLCHGRRARRQGRDRDGDVVPEEVVIIMKLNFESRWKRLGFGRLPS
ncbi:uncharacterized protein A4U43_C06F11760 [Asparagus officinalis]|uniref:Uncharacterized protein n=1 Tax=Asparagus officinalis TaxID=4686 RepID=A0A5P1ERW8_ASPOF|nr:uncharacterized protein A4U43_C06F11760 [Asparagus officinalis]